jgi:hypothetical protein
MSEKSPNRQAGAHCPTTIRTSTVEEITGAPAQTFLDWATDHAVEFRA